MNVIPGEGKSTSILLHPHRGNPRIKEKGREHRGVDTHTYAHAPSRALIEASVQNNGFFKRYKTSSFPLFRAIKLSTLFSGALSLERLH